jgi:hypothetical protein
MSARRKICVLIAVATTGMLVSACGFEPMLGQLPESDVQRQLEQIRVDPIPDRSGQILRSRLQDGLGSKSPSRYVLSVQLREPRQPLAVRRDDVISRFGYTANATFSLVEIGGKTIFGGSSSFTTDYEITNSEFATAASRDDARDRTLELVGNDIRLQIAVFFRSTAARR